MRRIAKFASTVLVGLSVAAAPLHAQFLQQFTRPSNAFGLIWTPVAEAPTTTIGNVTATANGGDWIGEWIAGTAWNGGFTDGEYLLFGIGTNIMTLDFASPINAFGTQAWYNQTGGTVLLEAYYLGNLVGSFSRNVSGGYDVNSNQAEVLAFTSTNAIDRVVLTASGEFAINQLGPETSTVPEPTSIALVAGGLMALGFASRRRTRRA